MDALMRIAVSGSQRDTYSNRFSRFRVGTAMGIERDNAKISL